MKIFKTTFVMLLAVALLSIVAAAGFASRADEMLADAAKATEKAKTAKTRTDKDEYYKKALDVYSEVAKKYPNSAQGAKALYGIAVVHRGVAESYTSTKKKSSELYQSYNTAKQLINVYDLPSDRLAEKFNLEDFEVREIREVVASGHKLKDSVAHELDRINSTDIKYKILDFLVGMTGRIPGFSYWFAIVLITVIVKLAITPLTKAQFKSMKEMQRVAPLIKEVQEKYKGDQKTIGEKTMAIYKEHGINPFASCLPILVQMPILMLLYYTIRGYEFQFAKGTFLWIGSGLAHLTSFPVPFNPGTLVWFTAANLAEPDLPLVLLYVASMYISTKLSAVDPSQAEQQKMMAIMMPVMFAFIFAGFPSAFLLYWLVFNILQTTQQYFILRGSQAITPAPTPPAQPEQGSGEERVRPRRRRRR